MKIRRPALGTSLPETAISITYKSFLYISGIFSKNQKD
jgi:hypothetical protein